MKVDKGHGGQNPRRNRGSNESDQLSRAVRGLPLGLLRPFITEEVRSLVIKRLKLSPKKLALLLVRMINPDEILTEQEKAIMAGRSRDWMRKQKREGNGSK